MLASNAGMLLFVLVCLCLVWQRLIRSRKAGLISRIQASSLSNRKTVDFSESVVFAEKNYVEFTTDEHGNVLIDSNWKDQASFWVRVVISGLVLLVALGIIVSKRFPADQEKWAFGVVGTILGYWLKS